MQVLVTGANGITGHAVIHQLVARGADVIGLVPQRSSQVDIESLGATPVVGDMRNDMALRQAMSTVERVYHICPDWVPDEVAIGEAVIAAARASDISLFGYHSTLAPYIEEVPSHWAKMQVNMALMKSGLAFSIIQPAAYMQDITGPFAQVSVDGIQPLPFRVDAPLSWADANDVGEAVAVLMTRPDQGGGTYELCGTETPLTTHDIAEILSQTLGRQIDARTCPFEEFTRRPPYSEYSAAQLERVKAYYDFVDKFGLRAGNSKVLAEILGRAPVTWEEFAKRRVRPS